MCQNSKINYLVFLFFNSSSFVNLWIVLFYFFNLTLIILFWIFYSNLRTISVVSALQIPFKSFSIVSHFMSILYWSIYQQKLIQKSCTWILKSIQCLVDFFQKQRFLCRLLCVSHTHSLFHSSHMNFTMSDCFFKIVIICLASYISYLKFISSLKGQLHGRAEIFEGLKMTFRTKILKKKNIPR